ncbi:peptidase family M1-domain-containing protein [Xylariales sp. AK1849]|nr:peptidase family M1-domain-containing protein [Xylariales sp. AK1849]
MREVPQYQISRTPPFRLPRTIKPRHYAIEIEPDLGKNLFNGKVIVDLDVEKPTNFIAFHSLRLRLTNISVKPSHGDTTYPVVQYEPENEIAFVRLKEKLPKGSTAVLTINYVGETTAMGSMGGLSPTPYQMPSGEVKLGFETMFEPVLARSVFPCLDEPDLKAQFTVSLVVDADLTCLSNMPVASEKPLTSLARETKKKVLFESTPLMSTYLVIMVAGYLNVLETDEFHVPIRVWASVDKDITNTAHALEIAVKVMKAHEKNFGLEYPLPKLDMVAIPGHSGGMEHWGCVTYDEPSLILNKNPSEYDKMRVAWIIAHELAHQWFGNIVTMKSWDAVWLNESFSDWATVYTISQIFPEWDSWANFLASDPSGSSFGGYQEALELDSNIGSHAIEDPNVPAAAAFDSIAYLKGCSIIRMMAENLGVDVFLEGIRFYLKKYMFGNATTEDLWDALSRISGRDVAGFMEAWTHTVGYPLLTVNELRPTSQIVVSQSRFLQNGDEDTEVEAYPVMIHLKGPDGVRTYPMTGKELKIPVNMFKYKLNVDQVGFYRVSYKLSRIHKLGLQLAGNFLSVKDIVGIISDQGAVVLTGAPSRQIRLSEFLDFLFVIKDRANDVFVLREMLGQLQKVRAAFLFEGADILKVLKSIRFKLLGRFIGNEYLEFKPEDSVEQTFLKVLLFHQLKDHPLAQEKATAAWNRLLGGDKDALNPNIRNVIFDTMVALDTTDRTWNDLKSIAFEKAYVHSTDPVTPREAFSALGSSPNVELVARTLRIITPSSSTSCSLSFATSESSSTIAPFVLNGQARNSILRALQNHPGGAEASWNWLVDNWDVLGGSDKGSISSYRFLSLALGGLATGKHLTQVKKFFADKVGQSFELQIAQAIDIIRVRARFVKADREDLLGWAKQRGFSEDIYMLRLYDLNRGCYGNMVAKAKDKGG